ncbi:restriction endonuclease subunit S [Teredinibacter sp. KSP-S5-2]|uniref:restriction endonuclease subunit S n=1 Tax=Teredinibacter sp. KSP-S5-2 TaxID=3034506 RepID=UPI002934FBD0|nr:restriction endonuclease subunit S [Teredinibacter sp. KSP-S5-2]WNO11763.1 restriction endonuclease subunit S [Teredinibacter sp. KSP-S5-2]
MKPTPLSQLTSISAGQGAPKVNEFSETGIPFVRAGSLEALLSGKNESELELVNEETAKQRKLKTYPKGTILFAKSGMSATKDRVYVLQNPAYVVSHLATLIPKDGAYVDYLRLALKRFPPSTLIKDSAYPAIGLGEIGNFEIPVPEELNDQIRIAHLLGKVEGLIAQRKQHLQHLDDLLKSVFLEMFGFNDKSFIEWTADKLATYTEVVSGVTKGKKYKTDDLISIPYMRVANVQDGHFVLDEIKTILVTQNEIDKYQLEFGDLLLTEGGDPDKLGRGSVWENQIDRCIHQNHIFRVRINDYQELNSYYLSALIGSRYGKSYFLKSAKQTTGIASINSSQLKNFPVVIPPIELQNQFAAIVEKVEALKSRYQQSLTDFESLYGALSQQAFKGELDLSQVPLPELEAERDKNAIPQEVQDNTADIQPELSQAEFLFTGLDLAAMSNPQKREGVLRQMFDRFISTNKANGKIHLDAFWQAARLGVVDDMDDDSAPFALVDYEHVKNWMFEALQNDTLTQTFDNEHNRLQLRSRAKRGRKAKGKIA